MLRSATESAFHGIVRFVQTSTSENIDLIRAFFRDIRNGTNLRAARQYLAPLVIAHQVCSEEPIAVERTPENYAEHIADMIDACEDFAITLDVVIADESQVYTRWTQRGSYANRDDDGAVAHRSITEFASAVYRIDAGRIVEYWIQVDRLGTLRQMQR